MEPSWHVFGPELARFCPEPGHAFKVLAIWRIWKELYTPKPAELIRFCSYPIFLKSSGRKFGQTLHECLTPAA